MLFRKIRQVSTSWAALWGVAAMLQPGLAAATDPAAGLAKSSLCASCHGAAGISPIATYPNLAGQHAAYLEHALGEFRDGHRQGLQADIMATVAKTLSPKDIADLAAYYASLK